MRKIIVYNIVSLDGYHTGLNNDVSVMFPMMGDKVFNAYTAERLRAADTFLIGRVSFELFNSFWPKVAQNPDSDEWTPEQREISRAGKSVPTVVVSDTLPDWLPEKLPDIRIIRRADAYERIAELKRQPGKDILMTGSRTLWNDLLAHGLVEHPGPLTLSHTIGAIYKTASLKISVVGHSTWNSCASRFQASNWSRKDSSRSYLTGLPRSSV